MTKWVRQEALVREAEALGLDRDDPIIRRRLAEKTELVLCSQASIERPTDAEIRAWIEENPEQVARDSRTSFLHAFALRDTRPSSAQADASRWVTALARAPDAPIAAGAADAPDAAAQARTLGDAFALGPEITRMTTGDIAVRFGDAFSTALAACEVGRSCGPIESRYGFHAVVVTLREAWGTLEFAAAKPIADRAILREREDASLARSIDALVTRDGVVRAEHEGRP